MNRTKIEDVLFSIGMPVGIKGFSYIVTTMEVLDDSENIYMSVTKELYPAIAKKHDDTVSRVERSIRHAFERTRDMATPEKYELVDYYIGFENQTNSSSLRKMYKMLKRDEENEKSSSGTGNEKKNALIDSLDGVDLESKMYEACCIIREIIEQEMRLAIKCEMEAQRDKEKNRVSGFCWKNH